MLKKERGRVAHLKTGAETSQTRALPGHRDTERKDAKNRLSRQRSSSSRGESSENEAQTSLEEREQPRVTKEEANGSDDRTKLSRSKQLTDDMSQGRREAFDVFRSEYPHNAVIEENKKTLKQRYGEAKALGEQVNGSRKRINTFKTQIEQHRIRRSMQVESDHNTDEEDRLRNAIEEEKSRYKEAFTRLRLLKTEIEHLQHLLEKSKVQMQKDFEKWWAEQSTLPHRSQNGKVSQQIPTAWKTPTPPLSPIKPQGSRPLSTEPRHRTSQEHFRTSDILASRLQTEAKLSSSASSHGVSHHDNVHQRSYLPSEMPTRGSQRPHNSNNRREIQDAYENAKRSNSSDAASSLQLTGDSRADEDILAFIRARQTLLDQKGSSPR